MLDRVRLRNIASLLFTALLVSGLPAAEPAEALEDGFVRLIPRDGEPQGWVVRHWSDVSKPPVEPTRWMVEDGILHGSPLRGTWLISEAEYGDFELKGVKIIDCDLNDQVERVARHDNTLAPPLCERPRRGHIGFQELGRGDQRVQIRNARLRVIDAKNR